MAVLVCIPTNSVRGFPFCFNFPFKEQASFNFMAAFTIHSDFGAQESKICHCFYFFLFYLPWSGRKVMTNLDSIFKSRDITLPTKVDLVKAMVFPVVMYGCESWTVKNAERRRIDAFELWCWRRLLRIPWTARRSNQSIMKEISPGFLWKDWC